MFNVLLMQFEGFTDQDHIYLRNPPSIIELVGNMALQLRFTFHPA